MTTGPVDNYLNEQEQEYFKSGGKNEESINYEQNSEPRAEVEASVSDEVSGAVDPTILESALLGQDESAAESTDGDEADPAPADSTETKRDYEKAFKAELHKRKELKEALDTQAKKTAEMESTLAQLKQSMLQPKAPPEEPKEAVPDPSEDPLGYQQYEIETLKKALKQHNEYLQNQHQSTQKQAQEQAFMRTYKESADHFATQNPDFYDAYKYIVKSKTDEFIAAGYTKAEAESLMIEDELAIASRAYQQQVNPAERIYALAKQRGYSTKAKTTTPSKNLDAIKRGLDNSKSLRSGGGELEGKNPGFNEIDGMNFKEFDDFWAGYKSKSKGQR